MAVGESMRVKRLRCAATFLMPAFEWAIHFRKHGPAWIPMRVRWWPCHCLDAVWAVVRALL